MSDFKEEMYKEIVEYTKLLLIQIFTEYKDVLQANKIDLEHPANLMPCEKIVGDI